MSELNLKVQSERLKIPMGGENKKLSCHSVEIFKSHFEARTARAAADRGGAARGAESDPLAAGVGRGVPAVATALAA